MINWDIFKANNEKKEDAFEGLCYMLFCKQYGQDYGIFSYRNQHYIETNIVEHEGEIIGFQSKFYEGSASNHIQELKEKMDAAKKKYNNITVLQYYIYPAFSQSSDTTQTKPQYQVELENHSKSLGIEVEWVTESQIEFQLNTPENKYIKELFFTNPAERKIFKYLDYLEELKSTYLDGRFSEIKLSEQSIKINRSEEIQELKNFVDGGDSILIISGDAGTGKTAIIKDWYDNSIPVLLFNSNAFACNEMINFASGEVDANIFDILKIYKKEDKKVFIIDSAERLFSLPDQFVFNNLLVKLAKQKWKIVFTCRSPFISNLKTIIAYNDINNEIKELTIENIEEKKLNEIFKNNSIESPQNEKVKKLLTIPFYLNQYLNIYNSDTPLLSYDNFISKLWDVKICDITQTRNSINIKRENAFMSIVENASISGNFLVDAAGLDAGAVEALKLEGVISYDSRYRKYFINHDIFEEWGIHKIIARNYYNKEGTKSFFESIGSSLLIRKMFKEHMAIRIAEDDVDFIDFIKNVILNKEDVSDLWKNEIIVSFLKSKNAGILLDHLLNPEKKDIDSLDNVMKLLLVGAKDINNTRTIKADNGDYYYSINPTGDGWKYVIKYLYDNFDLFFNGKSNYQRLINILHDWTNQNRKGETVKYAGLVAIKTFNCLEDIENGYINYKEGVYQKLFEVIANSSHEIKAEINIILESVISNYKGKITIRYYDFAEFVLKECMKAQFIYYACTDKVINLCDKFFRKVDYDDDDRFARIMNSREDVEDWFGLNHHFAKHNFFPASAYRTPIYWLLSAEPYKTMEFILNLTNYSVESFVESKKDWVEEIVVHVGSEKVKQYSNDRIWNMYMGTQVSTEILASIHMALEKFLLNNLQKFKDGKDIDFLKSMILKSKSASITAIVVSIICAHPQKYYQLAVDLLKTHQIFIYDIPRLTLTRSTGMFRGMNASHRIFDNERSFELKRKHRTKLFEHIILEYEIDGTYLPKEQFIGRLKNIQEGFDQHYKFLESKLNTTLAFALARMDVRKMKSSKYEDGSKTGVILESQLSEELDAISKENQEKTGKLVNLTGFNIWASKSFKKEEYVKEEYSGFESIWAAFIHNVELQKSGEDIFSFTIKGSIAYGCAVILRDYAKNLDKEKLSFIKGIVESNTQKMIADETYTYNHYTNPIISSQISLINISSKSDDIDKLFFCLAMSHNERLFDMSLCKGLDLLKSSKEARKFIKLFSHYIDLYLEVSSSSYGIGRDTFIKKYIAEISKLPKFADVQIEGKTVNFDSYNIKTLLEVFYLIDASTLLEEEILNLLSNISSKYTEHKKADKHYNDGIFMYGFWGKLSNLMILSECNIDKIINAIKDIFQLENNLKDFLEQILFSENTIKTYNRFWDIWYRLKEYVLTYPKPMYKRYGTLSNRDNMLIVYLFAWGKWGSEQYFWASFKEIDIKFFYELLDELKEEPAILYSVSKVLYHIGRHFNDGIDLISNIISILNFSKSELFPSTLYYLENFIHRFIRKNKRKINTDKDLRAKVINCLDFLVECDQPLSYIMRDNL